MEIISRWETTHEPEVQPRREGPAGARRLMAGMTVSTVSIRTAAH
ncbi:MAG TPA: hypothetical protein VFY45_04155 [Baekduia sp.]|nr:hypothetical protein [Baekduia sp.]